MDNSQNRTLDQNQINIFASKMQHIFQKSAKQSFKTYAVVSKKVKNSKPWFGIQCHKALKRYYTARKNNALYKNEITKRIMINACKHYKSTTRKYYKKHITGLKNKIRRLRTDCILNEYITSTKHIFIPIYKKLYNIMLENGTVPSDWVKGNIIPLYKNKGSKIDPAKYRPITLLSCVGKLFTSILYHRHSTFLEENKILNETQSGFRKEYSTIDNIFTMHGLIEYFKSKKSKLYCCFVDFTKAFDSVWRDGLWQNLLTHGIQGKTFDIIKNMYNEIKSCVTVNGCSSGFFKCQQGYETG